MSMKISESLSRQLSTVSFIATVLVVMCHCDDFMANKNFPVQFLGGIFSDANVHNFFFLSGFFVATRFTDAGWYRTAIFKRLRTLGIPYLIWCILYLCENIFSSRLGFHNHCLGRLDLWNVFGIGFLTPPIDFALWYIKTLFYFIIVSPFFFRLQYKSKWTLPIIACVIFAIKISPIGRLPEFRLGFNLVGFCCFLLGAQMAFSKDLRDALLCSNTLRGLSFIATRFGAWLWLIDWVGAAIFIQLTGGLLHQILHPLYIVFSVICLHQIVANLPWRVVDLFTKSSFIIYASHFMILHLISPFCNNLFAGKPISCYMTMLIVSLSSGVLVTVLLRSISPVLLSLLSSGRG